MFRDAIKVFVTGKSLAATRNKIYAGEDRVAKQWQKLDIQKVSRKVNLISEQYTIIGQQFFLLEFALFRSRLPPWEQLGQKLRKLVKSRICWKSGYCEWQLAVHYSWITRLLCWDGEPAESKTEREGKNGWTRRKESKGDRDGWRWNVQKERGKSFPVETSKTVLTTQQNKGRFVRLSLNVLDPKDSP